MHRGLDNKLIPTERMAKLQTLSKTTKKQSPTGEMTAPLIELALRVQLSGVPPAYGSWLLTPRPPLHEGEKQPAGQEGKKNHSLVR